MPADDNYFIGNCGVLGASEALTFLLGDSIRHPSRKTIFLFNYNDNKLKIAILNRINKTKA
jgi:hypothetical protein